MRNAILILLISFVLTSCGGSDAPAISSAGHSGALTTIQWIDSAKDFGSINEGQKLALSFKFKNAGQVPLVIESVKPTCGCTIADYPKEPIAPGKEGEITGEFDSNGREGMQHKHMTVRSNVAGQAQDISFQVNVIPKERGNGQ